MNRDTALRNVVDLLTALQSVGVNAWLQDGTLLGLVRDGKLIEWDHDTDTGCLMSDWTPEAHAALERAGFKLQTELGTRDNGWQHRWVRKGEKTDIFFHYLDGDTQWHAAYCRNEQYRYAYPLLKLAPFLLLDQLVLAPSPPEAFLETKYGLDWRTPKRAWHFATGPVNSRRMPS